MKTLDVLNLLNYNRILTDIVCMLFIIKKGLYCLVFKHFVGFCREGFDPNLDVDDCYGSDSDDEDLPDVLTPSRQGNHKGQRSLLDKIKCQSILCVRIKCQSKKFTLHISQKRTLKTNFYMIFLCENYHEVCESLIFAQNSHSEQVFVLWSLLQFI